MHQILYSQTIIGAVVGENNAFLSGAIIQDLKLKNNTVSDKNGRFEIESQPGNTIRISHIGYETKEIVFNSSSDTIWQFIALEVDIRQLPKVDISSSKIETIVDQFSVNVIDYVPYENFILTLKSNKSNRYICLENNDTTFFTHDLKTIKGKSLFEDCYGNIHVLTKDSAYQIWIDVDLRIIDRTSIKSFNENILPCVGSYENESFFSYYSDHNSRYTLFSIAKNTHERKRIYSIFDKVAWKAAREFYYLILANYHAVASINENIIRNGLWDGELISLAINSDLLFMIAWFKNTIAKEVNIKSFQLNENIVSFDLEFDSLHIYDQKTQQYQHLHLSTTQVRAKKSILMDKMTNHFYEYFIDQGIVSITPIDIQTGILGKQIKLNGVSFPRSLQVFNNWVYFKDIRNGFHKLYRISL